MKLQIKTTKLQEMLSKAIKGASNNKLIPLTGLIAIQLKDNKLTLTTTDATNYLYIQDDNIEGDDFYAVVQVDTFAKLVARMTCETITIDLIFGVAGFGDAVLRRSILTALSLGVQHISAYHLTIEPDTAFGRRLRRGELSEVAEGQSEREYRLVEELLTASGYEHYEVSNYALEGFRSRHNSSYWQGVEYLGIGSGAHSFNGDVRRWCQQPLPQYITNREYESETLSSTDRYNEYLMTSLRCAEGVDLQRIASQFGDSATTQLLSLAEPWIDSGKLLHEGNSLRIPTSEFLLSDSIISSLFEL